MKKLLILLAVLLVMVSGVALAQEGQGEAGSGDLPTVFCGTLADADCQILLASQQAMTGLTGATVNLVANLNISNIPDTPFDSLAFQLNGDGAYSVDAETMSTLQSLQGAPDVLLENMQELPQLLEEAVNSFQGQLNLTLTMPEELVSQAAGDQQIPDTLSVELRLVNGVAYLDLSSLAESLPDANIPNGWFGLELSRLLRSAMEESLEQMDAQGGIQGMLPPGFDLSTFSRFSDPDVLGEFLTVERLDDDDIGGEAVAVFRTRVDYAGLMSSEAFQELMQQQMEAAGGETMSDADREQAMQMMQQMFEGLAFESTQYIDVDDNFVRRQQTTFNWDLQNMMSATGEDTSQGAPVINFDFTINYDNFNSAPTIEAPTAAQVITAEQAMALMFGGMMGSDGTGDSSGAGSGSAVEATPTATPGS
ncbi:MAG: hypothetical protein HZC41_26370 [Chloroflexi bacterium]|nr:hypothetical protein [Chloroflexota bacterium]